MSQFTPHREVFSQLVTLGESVTEALDYTQLVCTNGERDLEKTFAALAERELPQAAIRALVTHIIGTGITGLRRPAR